VVHGGLQAGRRTEIARRHAGFHLFGKRMHGGLAEVMTSKQMGGPVIAVALRGNSPGQGATAQELSGADGPMRVFR
jgi:hypothetical protein